MNGNALAVENGFTNPGYSAMPILTQYVMIALVNKRVKMSYCSQCGSELIVDKNTTSLYQYHSKTGMPIWIAEKKCPNRKGWRGGHNKHYVFRLGYGEWQLFNPEFGY